MANAAPFGAGKKALFWIVMLGLVLSVTVAFAEVLLRAVDPQPYMIPRYQYSEHYGHELPPNTAMVAKQPGVYEFTYTINEFGYRGEAVPLSDQYEIPNIVVLGDSYAMGAGVEDNEVFSAVMGNELGGCFNVVNLGVGGYGLTHQIRRYYEFGILYRPEVVVLQFFHNDPSDNFHDRVTVVERGEFFFRPTRQRTSWLKQLLSDSILQHSQVYNLLRNAAYRTIRRQRLNAALTPAEDQQKSATNEREHFYNELLRTFADDLDAQGVDVIFIAVNHSLDRFPAIKQQVFALEESERFRYLEVVEWFAGLSNYESPEGHAWGAQAHRIVGQNLARAIRGELLEPDSTSGCARAQTR